MSLAFSTTKSALSNTADHQYLMALRLSAYGLQALVGQIERQSRHPAGTAKSLMVERF